MIYSWLRRIAWFVLLIVNLGGAAGCLYYYQTQSSLSDVSTLNDVTFETPLKIYSADNKLIAEYGEHRRIPLKIEQIPEKMRNAFLAIEDSRFYEHFGIDPVGIVRAALVSFKTGRPTQGASTITQQVARNFFLSREKTITRKIKEIFLSWKIEQSLTKDQILELYLNKIALGHHSYGVGAAAFVYFGKTVDQLTLGEIAIIAGLPKAPSTFNPISSPTRAKERRHLVLKRMLDLGYITKEEYQQADNEPVISKYHTTKLELNAPYVAESIRVKLEQTYGKRIYTEGFKAYATINSKNQTSANRALYDGIMDYDMRHGYYKPANVIEQNVDPHNLEAVLAFLSKKTAFEYIAPAVVTALDKSTESAKAVLKTGEEIVIPWKHIKWARAYKNESHQGASPKHVSDVLTVGDLVYVEKIEPKDEKSTVEYALRQIPHVQSALISLNAKDGSILAMVGGFSFKQSSFNRVEQANRQGGSNLKPFLYSSALASGYSLATLMLDDRISIWNPGSKKYWSPKNSPNKYECTMPLRQALAKSKNVVSVRLIRAIGLSNFIKHFEKFGFKVSKYQRNETLSLGAYEVTPLKLATAYATFANGGFKIEPYLISKIIKGDKEHEEVFFEYTPAIACRDCPDAVVNNVEPLPIENVAMANEQHGIAPQILTHGNAFLIANTLRSAIEGGVGQNGRYYGTGGRANALNRTDIAGKTGTTNQSRDAWFSGFNANIVTTVWVGFDNFTPLGSMESGGKAALPIWINYMRDALKDQPLAPIVHDDTIYQSKQAGYSEYFMKDVPLMLYPPREEASDFGSSCYNRDSDSSSGSVDELFN